MWFPFALTFAIVTSLTVIIAKRIMKEADEYLYLWLNNLFTLPFLLAIVLIFYQIPRIDRSFILATVGAVAISVVAAILAYRAIKISEVSLVNPISSFNPVFTAIISFIVLGEKISFRGVLGILLVVGGAYLLQISESKKGALAPIKALASHRGVQLSLVAYFLWAITPSLEKTAIFHTSPQVPPFASLAGMVGAIALYTPIVAQVSKKPIDIARRHLKLFVLSGFLGGIGMTAAFTAFSLANLGLVTATFKLSMIFTVVLGWLFFKEKEIKSRLLGSIVMLIGVVLLVT